MSPTLARLFVRLDLLRPDCLRVLVSADPLRVEAPLLVETLRGERPNEPNGFCLLQDQRPAAKRYPS